MRARLGFEMREAVALDIVVPAAVLTCADDAIE
jgi:hypothetical protein